MTHQAIEALREKTMGDESARGQLSPQGSEHGDLPRQPHRYSYEDAAERRTVEGWICKGCRRWWGEDEHMSRWCCAADLPCPCGARMTKGYTICDACRAKKDSEKWEKRERKPYDGGLLYSDALGRYFDDAEDVADWIAGEDDGGHDYESLRLLLCDKTYARQIDMDDFFTDDLPEDSTLDDVAGDIAEAIAAVNEVIAARRKDGRQLSWLPSKYAVDIATLPPLEAPQADPAVDPHVVSNTGTPSTRAASSSSDLSSLSGSGRQAQEKDKD